MNYKLSEIMDILGGGTPKTSRAEYWDGDIPWLSVKDFNNDYRYVYESEKKITEAGLNNSSTQLLQSDDIIISARGTVGAMAMVPFPMAFNQSCYGLRGKPELVDQCFLYYLVKHNVHVLQKNTHGSVFDTITRDTFSGIEVDIPSLQEQRAVAATLKILDDKIELNNRINENLEEQAQAIYKAWFCNYLLTDGTQPLNWHDTTIGELTCLVVRGITPKYNDDTDQVVLNQKCIRNHMIDLTPARHHLPKAINEKRLERGDLLINSTGEGTLGRVAQVWFTPENLTVDSHVTIVRPKSIELQNYIGLWGLTHETEIEALHTGSTGQTELPRERVKAMELLLPDAVTLSKFNEIVTPITQCIVKNQEENARLTDMRNTLLPKLMSGELEVSEVEI